MSSYFDTVTTGINVPLTRLAAGYGQPQFIAEKLFPVAKSILSKGQIPIYNKDAFKMYQTYRALGAKSNRAQISPDSWINFSCEEHDLAYPIDQRLIDELKAVPIDARGKAFFDIQNRTRKRVQFNMQLELEKRIADKVQSTANYTNNNFRALTGSDCWSETGSTPVQDIEDAKELIRSKLGTYPNCLYLGPSTYSALKFHADYTNRMTVQKDKIVSLDWIKSIHELKEVWTGESMGLDSDDTTFTDLWEDTAILYYKPLGGFPDVEEPSFGYIVKPMFPSKPYPYVDVFTEEGGKIINIRCTDMYGDLFVLNTAGYLFKNTVK